jgi:hypothetical protein
MGRGDGLAAAALNPRPRDLTSPQVQQQTDGELLWKIEQGRGAMPAWLWLSLAERWAGVSAIRAIAGGRDGSAAPLPHKPASK